MSDDTIHEGNWVKVKCWNCGGATDFPTVDCLISIRCFACSGFGYIMHCTGLKPAPAPVKEGAD